MRDAPEFRYPRAVSPEEAEKLTPDGYPVGWWVEIRPGSLIGHFDDEGEALRVVAYLAREEEEVIASVMATGSIVGDLAPRPRLPAEPHPSGARREGRGPRSRARRARGSRPS